MVTRIFLALVSLTFISFGLWSLVTPTQMAASLGVDVSGPNGAFELAGIYGGVSLGAAALTGAGALIASMRRPALWFLVTYMGGYIFARPIAWVMHGAPTPDFYIFMAFEASVLIGAVASLVARAK